LFEVLFVVAEGLTAAAKVSAILKGTVRLPGGKCLPSRGEFYRRLDAYARPRLFLGKELPTDQGLFRDELLLQLALWARKFGHLQASRHVDDELVRLFMRYAARIVRVRPNWHDDQWQTALHDVYLRLFHSARPGKGISAALGRADTFRSYVRQALIGAMRHSKTPRRRRPADGGFPPTIAEAAERLEVSFTTVWRRFRAGKWPVWCAEAWEQIESQHRDKSAWRKAAQLLHEEGGGTREAARKAAYRAKKAGRTPDALRRRFGPCA